MRRQPAVCAWVAGRLAAALQLGCHVVAGVDQAGDQLGGDAAQGVAAGKSAVAVAMRDGPETGLALIDGLAAGELADFRYLHAARADLLRRLGRKDEARLAYEAALKRTEQAVERQFLEGRIEALNS